MTDQPTSYSWTELIDELRTRTTPAGGNPISIDDKIMQTHAGTFGKGRHTSAWIELIPAEKEEFFEFIATQSLLTLSPLQTGSGSPAPAAAAPPPAQPKLKKRTCDGKKNDGGPCGSTVGLRQARDGNWYDTAHFDQGNKDPEPPPAPSGAPAAAPLDEVQVRQAIQDKVGRPRVTVRAKQSRTKRFRPHPSEVTDFPDGHREYPSDVQGDCPVYITAEDWAKYCGGEWDSRSMPRQSQDLRAELNGLIKQLPGYHPKRHHSARIARLRNRLLDGRLKVEDLTLEPKPRSAPSGVASTASTVAAPPPKKSSKSKKKSKSKAVKPPKKQGAKSAPPKTNRSSGSGKGSAMPVRTADDLELQLEDRKSKKVDYESEALAYYTLWRRKKTDADKADVLDMLKADKQFKKLKPHLPPDMLEALGSDGKKDGKIDPALKAKVEKYKAKGKSNIEALAKLVDDDDVDDKLAEAAVDAVYKNKGA